MNNKRNIYIVIVAIVIIAVAIVLVYNEKKKEKIVLSYVELMEEIENNKVSEIVLSNSEWLSVEIKESDKVYEAPNPRTLNFKESLLLKGITVREADVLGSTLPQSLFSILIIGVVFFMTYRLSKKSQQATGIMSLEVTEAKGTTITFSDVAGNDEAKESVADIVEFIKNPHMFEYYGAHMPKGIIFYGPPGTGKTLLAKAIAKESEVPIYAVSGSDFVQMYVGVGASRIRDLFKKARASQSGKAVIFIDEIDALGKKRTNQAGGGNEERDQTLNALLTEMSGFQSTEGIVVIAATNRLDMLDEALLRPGRFDRQIEIKLPDVAGRESILKCHGKNKPLDENISIQKLAKQTVYFSGAMLENLLNEAAIVAAKNKNEKIMQKDIDKAYYTIIAGAEKKSSQSRQIDKEITAYHEAGHALVTKIAAPENTVSKVTIIPSTKGAGGFCVNIPPDKMFYTKKEIEAQIMISLGGRAAEEIIFGKDNITTGASNDLEKATGLLKDYITKFGMSEKYGLLSLGQWDNKEIFEDCKAHMERLYDETRKLIIDNKDSLCKIATILLEKETIDEDVLDLCL